MIVGDPDRRQMATQLAAHLASGTGVERRERLVHSSSWGSDGQRARQGDPLGLAAGQRPGLALRQLLDAQPAQHLARRLAGLARATNLGFGARSATLSTTLRWGNSR